MRAPWQGEKNASPRPCPSQACPSASGGAFPRSSGGGRAADGTAQPHLRGEDTPAGTRPARLSEAPPLSARLSWMLEFILSLPFSLDLLSFHPSLCPFPSLSLSVSTLSLSLSDLCLLLFVSPPFSLAQSLCLFLSLFAPFSLPLFSISLSHCFGLSQSL